MGGGCVEGDGGGGCSLEVDAPVVCAAGEGFVGDDVEGLDGEG